MTFYDYATPAIEAGAEKNDKNNDWLFNDEHYGDIEYLCRSNGIKPIEKSLGAGRTFKAIQKDVRTYKRGHSGRGKHEYIHTAIRYMFLMNKVDLPFVPYNANRFVKWGKASDGSNRISHVDMQLGLHSNPKQKYEPDWKEVPNWDFVPKVEQES